MKMENILGMNARNHRFTSVYNRAKGKRIANSKLLTKEVLGKAKLPIPKLYQVFENDEDVDQFDFSQLTGSFVVKPNKGLGGEGIMVIRQQTRNPGVWLTTEGEEVTEADLKLHIADIMEGRFSMHDLPDAAFLEERVRIHPMFRRYAYHGTPDIRVVIFNKVPVMAMLRIPTKESGGRANLHQGAVGAGIDLAAGITTHAIQYEDEVVYMPETRKKIRGIRVPEWEEVLKLAIRCQEVTGLGYLGADIVLQPSKKSPGKTLPKVLELNAQPGLKIQMANRVGLLRRLERIEGLEVDTAEKGIRIAQELFGDRNLAHLGKKAKVVGVFETIAVLNGEGKKTEVKAKIDTGAWRTSIDREVAERLGLLKEENILYKKGYRSALGRHRRPVVGLTFYMKGRKIKTAANVADRRHLKRPMIIGRNDLNGFLVEI
jgi:alpha-L-glutamate ligase-like protein